MKKIWTCVLTLALAAAVACGGGGTDSAAGGDAAPANGGDAAAEAPADGGEEASAEGEKVENFWANAEVGDWAKYESSAAGVTTVMTWTVTAISDTEVTYDMVVEASGMTMPAQSVTLPLVAPEVTGEVADAVVPEVETSEVTLEAGGTTWDCILTKTTTGDSTAEVWMSADMPLGGLIKSVATSGDMTSTMTLVEWGKAGGAEEAPAA